MQLVLNTCSFPSRTSPGEGERGGEARMLWVGKGGQELPLRCVFQQFPSSYSVPDKGAVCVSPLVAASHPRPSEGPRGSSLAQLGLEIPELLDNDGSGADRLCGPRGLHREAGQRG